MECVLEINSRFSWMAKPLSLRASISTPLPEPSVNYYPLQKCLAYGHIHFDIDRLKVTLYHIKKKKKYWIDF